MCFASSLYSMILCMYKVCSHIDNTIFIHKYFRIVVQYRPYTCTDKWKIDFSARTLNQLDWFHLYLPLFKQPLPHSHLARLSAVFQKQLSSLNICLVCFCWTLACILNRLCLNPFTCTVSLILLLWFCNSGPPDYRVLSSHHAADAMGRSATLCSPQSPPALLQLPSTRTDSYIPILTFRET